MAQCWTKDLYPEEMRRVSLALALAIPTCLTVVLIAPGSLSANPHMAITTGAFANIGLPDGTSQSYQYSNVSSSGSLNQITVFAGPSGPDSISLSIFANHLPTLTPGDYTLGGSGASGVQVHWSGPTCSTYFSVTSAGIEINEVTEQAGQVTQIALQYGVAGDCAGTTEVVQGSFALNAANTTPGQGYYLYGPDGSLAGFGNDGYLSYLGDPTTLNLSQPVVGMATTPDGAGYWMVASDGGIFAYGDAGYFGSMGAIRLNRSVVGMTATPDGLGYWMVASDGGIFAFGDASSRFYGSMGGRPLNSPVVGMATTPDGRGYWMVAADGGVFSFGDAGYYGSMGATHLNQPVVGMATTPDGRGYWMVAADGGIFAFGDAQFYGSMGGTRLAQPIVGLAADPGGTGYWMVAADGGVFAFNAPFYGSLGGTGTSGVVGLSD